MTVKELKKKLENLPDDMEILMSKDEEGNDFKHLYEVEIAQTREWDKYEIDVMHPDDYNDLDDEDKELTKKRVVLWP